MLVIWNGPDPRQHSGADQGYSNESAPCPDVLGKWGVCTCWLPGRPTDTRVRAMGRTALSGDDASESMGPWWVNMPLSSYDTQRHALCPNNHQVNLWYCRYHSIQQSSWNTFLVLSFKYQRPWLHLARSSFQNSSRDAVPYFVPDHA